MDDAYRKKVLLVHNSYQIPGGEDTVVENEKKMLESRGHTVILYKRNNEELGKMKRAQKLLFPLTVLFSLKTYREVKKLIKEEHVDIVHVHNTLCLISPSVYYAAFSCKIPVVQTVHNFRLICPGALLYRKDRKKEGHICEECLQKGMVCAIRHKCYRNSYIQTAVCVFSQKFHRIIGTYKRINAYICLSGFSKEKLTSLLSPDKIYIKPNYAPMPPADLDKKTDEKKDYYLYMGRLEIDKGIVILLEAFSQLKDKRLIIIGSGTYEAEMKNTIKEDNLTHIEYKGYCTGKAKEQLLKNANALIVPSQWYEGMPMSVIESYSYGVPVIASDIGTLSELVEEGVSGVKFQYNSSQALVESIHRFEAADINEIRENCRILFRRKYSETVNYNILMQIYDMTKRKQ